MAGSGSAFAFIQRQFAELSASVTTRLHALRRERNLRALLAYGFKILAALGGLYIATGPAKGIAQAVGVGIAVVVVCDQVFANHFRLIQVTKAVHAYEKAMRSVKRRHTEALGPLLALRDRADPSFEAGINELNNACLTALHSQEGLIEDALAAADLKALERLSLDDK
jgi:hypothetical protein